MSGESDPKDSEGENSSEARFLSLDSEAPVFPANNDSFKRPRTPPDDEPYLTRPVSRAFTPISRPQTPLYRTEIKSISKLSDCVIPTIQPGTNLKEITVAFGSTYIRKSVIRHFKIENLKSSPFILEATLDPLKGTGFSLEVEGVGLQATENRLIYQAASPVSGEPKKCVIEVPSMTTIAIPIKWMPSKLGKVRLMVPFLSKGVVRGFRLILVGHVVAPPSLKARISDKSQEKSGINKRPLITTEAVERISTETPDVTAIATPERIKRLRNVYNANTEPRNLGWVKESNQAFAELLNFAMAPFEFKKASQLETKSLAHFSFIWEKLFIRSRSLVIKSELTSKFKCLHLKVARKEIKLRKEFNVLNNIGLKRDIVNIFLQIELVWLTLAFEIVLGRKGVFAVCLEEEQTKELVDEALFGHAEYGFDRDAAEKRFLEKLLRLLTFLDAALKAELIPGHMRLFMPTAQFRSTQAFFDQLKVKFFDDTEPSLDLSFTQAAHEDINPHIDDLSQDLRDGVRLCYLASLLTGCRDILDLIRLPVKNYQASVDNQCLLFDLMNQNGIITDQMVSGATLPCDIANGDRQKTLGLIWEVGRSWQLPKLIDSKFFSTEIIQLKYHTRRRFGRQLEDLSVQFSGVDSPLVSKLLTWVAGVAAFFDLKVTNFTSSFEDGRVLCCLVSHYFPRLLPSSMIIGPPSQEDAPPSGLFQSKRPKSNSFCDITSHNFDLFKRVVVRLGGMPTFVSFSIDGSINEHLVVLYVAHLAHRIQTLVTQEKSARCIQTYWRSKSKAQRELEASSALVIQRAFRVFYFRQRMSGGTAFQYIRCAIVLIQAVWRRRIALNEYRRRYISVLLIQRLYKTKIQRTQFLKFRSSLSSAQSLCRRILAQRRLAAAKNKNRVAIKIQACVKGFRERSKFKQLKAAAQAVQQARRRFIQARNTRLSYIHFKENVVSLQKIRRRCVANRDFITQRNTAATILQAIYRRMLAQKELMGLKRSHQAAIRIQSYFKRSYVLKAFTLLKEIVIKVQTRRRASLLARLNMQRFQEIRAAVLFIQARFRLVTFQKHQQWTRFCAATAIHAQFKRFLAVKRYQQLLATTLKLQRRRRALVVGRDSRKAYLNTQRAISCLQRLSRRHLFIEHQKQTAAITLQSACRVHCARKLFHHLFSQKKASKSIQALVRGYFIRSQLAKLKQATAIVQIRRRSCVAVRKLLSFFRMTRHSALAVQRTWRHQQLCQNIQQSFLAIREAATLVSQRRRQLVLMRTQRQTYLQLKAAALNSQRIYRHSCFGRRIRTEFMYQKQLVTSIQAHRRSAVARSNYQLLRHKASGICRIRRNNVHARNIRAHYAGTKQRLINIQRLFRHNQIGAAMRSNYLQLRSAATVIQSVWRMHAARQAYLKLIQAANLVAMRRRQLIRARECHQLYLQLKCTTIIIQQRWRQTQCQRAIHQQYNLFRASSIIIQSYWRRHQVISQVVRLSKAVGTVSCYRRRAVLARQTRLGYLSLRTSTIYFQRIFRLYRLGRDTRVNFIQMRVSAIMIQSSWRRAVAHQNFSTLRCAATLVAKRRREALLTSQIRHEYLTLLKVAIAIQAQRRMVVSRREYLQLCWAETVVSKRRLQTILTRQTHAQFSCLRASVVFIQQRYRLIQYGNLIRASYLQARAAAVAIQAQWRMTLMRTDFEWLRWAATLVSRLRNQALLARETRQQYLCLRDSSITLQRWYRLVTFGRLIQEDYITTRKAAIMIQAQWRMASARKQFTDIRHAASIVATKRRNILLTRRDCQSFEHLREAAVVIQQGFRNIQYGRSIRSSYLLCRSSAITIQSQWRMFTARNQFTDIRHAASVVATKRRNILLTRRDRQSFEHLRESAVVIQQGFRNIQYGRSIRSSYLLCRSSAITIQSQWRMVSARNRFIDIRHAAAKVTMKRRDVLLARRDRQSFEHLREAAVVIQQGFRNIQYGRSIRSSYLLCRSSAITIQSQWRMFTARRDFTRLQTASSFVSQRRRQALDAREERQQYLHLKAITIIVQARYRSIQLGTSIRHAFVIYQTAAIKLQATWKMFKVRSYFKTLIWATRVIAYRRSLALYTRDVIQQYKLLRLSTITIQQRFRHLRVGFEARNRYIQVRHAAISIQALWRKVAAQSNFVSLRWAAATITYFRSNLLLARVIRQQYISLKAAAVVIQNRFRLLVIGRISRNAFEEMRYAAIIIQSQWRLASARSSYAQLRWAASLVAAKRRGIVLARLSSQRYLELRIAIVYVQQRYRLIQLGNTLRNQFKIVRASAITIQAYWRRATACSDFLWLKWASTLTVRRRKQLLLARGDRNGYLHLRSSAILIQSQWRMVIEISKFRKLQQTAILISQRRRYLVLTRETEQNYQTIRASTIAIQAVWRMSISQSDYSWLRWSAILVAKRRRQLVQARSTRREYLDLQRATLAVQERRRATILTRSVRDNYLRMRSSAINIQAMWRRVMASSDFVWLRWAASIVVYHRRNTVLARNIHQEYTLMRNKVIFIQQQYRLIHYGRTVQANFEAMKRSAVVIQASWRQVSARSSFLWLRWAADVVSERRRQLLLVRDAQQNYVSIYSATIFIQQRYRLIKHGEIVRANYKAMRNSAIVIQTHWRCVTARSSFLWHRWAASIVSQRRRQALQASFVRFQYLEIQAAAVFLQRRYRLIQAGEATQAKFIALKKAATKIQAQWRRADAKAKFSYLKNAAVLVAQRRRQSVLARATHQQYIHLKSTIILLQNIYRNHQLGRSIRERFILVRSSAIVIQSYWRGVTAHVDYAWLVWASRVVAQRRRLLLLSLQTREQFLRLKAAACFIQQTLRNNCQAANIRNSYIAEKIATIKLQTLWRRAIAVRNFLRLQRTAHFITRLRHQSVIARTVRFEYLQLHAAAIFVQRKYRQNRNAALIHRGYIELKSAVITLQAHWKRLVARSNFLWLRWAAQCIADRRKAALQAREERGQYMMLTWGAVVAQRAFRHYRTCAVIRAQYIQMVNSALVIQHTLRVYWHRQAIKEQATILIQSHWRGRQIRVGFLMLRWAATFSSACRRARAIQIEYSRVRSAAIAIQRCWRHLSFGAQCQLEFQQLRLASTLAQRLYRRRATIRNNCAIQIQNAWYSWKQRTTLHAVIAHKWSIRSKWKATVTKVIACQILWRHFESMKTAAKFSKLQAISSMLSIWRTKCDTKLAAIREARLVQLKSESAAFIQVICRGYLARKRLWAAQTIAIGTQSLYRGYLVRKSSLAEVQEACRGVVRACREAKPHMMLSYRTTEALEILNRSSSLTRIIHACEHLVVVTQLSSSCRQRLVNQYHVIKIILELMRSCNRSQPHQEILRHAVVILENISRDPNCDWGMYVTPKEVDDLVVTMLDHKDLHHILTSLMVTLNYLMSHPVGFQSVVSTPQILTRLRMIHLSMQRHQRKFPNAPLLDHSLPLRSAKYSIGLVGLSSLDTFDQNEMMTSFIHKLKV